MGELVGEDHDLAVSADGNQFVAGAIYEDGAGRCVTGDQTDDSRSRAGAVYRFNRSGSTWIQTEYIKSPDPGVDDFFGQTATISGGGGTIAIGNGAEDVVYIR